MSVSNFIKQNFALVLGIALPVVLVLGFMLLAATPKMLGPPPQYAVVFSVQNYKQGPAAYNIDYLVKGDKLYARLHPNRNDYSYYRQELYIFDAQTGSLKKIEPDIPDTISPDAQRDIAVEEFADTRLSTDIKSPDGFTLESARYRSRGVAGELFGGGYSRYESGLRHEKGYLYRIPEYAGVQSYHNIQFLGWIIPQT